MAADENTGKLRAAELRAAGIHTVEDLLFRLETADREADHWIYIACDRNDDGALRLVNATGFFPDELSAGLAGETYARNWGRDSPDDLPVPETFAIPLFIESEKS